MLTGPQLIRFFHLSVLVGLFSSSLYGQTKFEIVSQPENVTAGIGGTASLIVVVRTNDIDRSLSYQWLHEGTNLPGATAPALWFNDVQPIHAGSYTVMVGDGLESVASAPAFLNVVGVVSWGMKDYGEGGYPPGLTNTVAIATGYSYTITLQRDGTVVGGGLDELGDLAPPPGLSNVMAIAAGYFNFLALRTDGTVVQWGRLQPPYNRPPAGLNGVIAIASGGLHSLALQNDGVWLHGATTPMGKRRRMV
jgi:hypothetical protein